MKAKALDVSKWDGVINWPTVKEQGFNEVFIRAGYGYVTDPRYMEYRTNSAGYILIRHTYWYFYPSLSWQTQADKYLLTIGTQPVEEGVCIIDVEETGGILPVSRVLEMARMFADYLDDKLGRTGKPNRTGIYTANWIWKQLGGYTATWAQDRPLWLAGYPYDLAVDVKNVVMNTFFPRVVRGELFIDPISPWVAVEYWQCSAKGSVNGVEALDVDLDASRLTIEQELVKFGVFPFQVLSLEELTFKYYRLAQWAQTLGYKE